MSFFTAGGQTGIRFDLCEVYYDAEKGVTRQEREIV
jgi:hypothetical protein